jgi:hypothetical protein
MVYFPYCTLASVSHQGALVVIRCIELFRQTASRELCEFARWVQSKAAFKLTLLLVTTMSWHWRARLLEI